MSKDDVAELRQFDETPTDKAERLKHEKELIDAQAFIDAQAAKCVEEFPDLVSSEDTIKQLKEQKAEKERQRWHRFHYMGKD